MRNKAVTTALAAGALLTMFILAPSPAFASTGASTTLSNIALIASLKAQLQVLEAELATILGQQLSSTTSAASTTSLAATSASPITTQFTSSKTAVSGDSVLFDIKFAISTNVTTVDISQSNVTFQYQASNLKDATQIVFTLNCPQIASYGAMSYCEIPPNSTQNLELIGTVPLSAITNSTGNGLPQITISSLKYYTGLSTLEQNFGYYYPIGLRSGTYLIVNQG